MIEDLSVGTRAAIEEGRTALGIEFGSTRIKAVLIGEDNAPIAGSQCVNRGMSARSRTNFGNPQDPIQEKIAT